MKCSFIFSLLIFSQVLSGQILCIKCYDQNDSISSGVNNLLLNGSFENNSCNRILIDCFCPNSLYYSCDIKDWNCTGGGLETYVGILDSTHSIIADGLKVVDFGNYYATVCSTNPLDQSCLKYSQCTVTGIPIGYPRSDSIFGGYKGVSLEQTALGLIPGNDYVLEFWASGASVGGSFLTDGIFALDIGFGNIFLRCKPTQPLSSEKGTVYIIEFRAISSLHTIKFTNWGRLWNRSTQLILDNVRLYTLAELSPSVTPCVTATNNFKEDVSIEIYPNPFSNELHVKSNGPSEIILYDVASRKILQQMFQKSVVINTELLDKGIYFYEVRGKSGLLKTGKVVKE